MLRTGIELLSDRPIGDAIAYRSALLALALHAQGKRKEAADALDAAKPERLLTRVTHALASGRVLDDLSAAREAVALASETEALNLHADAHASLSYLLASHADSEAQTQREIALDLYEQKGNDFAAQALRTIVSQV
jgi:hypothetical protein